MTCVRKAWLTLGSSSILLEDVSAGYVCPSLDLGSPDVREVVNNNPDRDGITDRTMYLGKRVITAQVMALKTLGAQIDAVAESFAPYMHPAVRPTLHYILDTPGAPERTLVVRGASYDWKVEGDEMRDIQLQWVASDPVAISADSQLSTAWSGAAVIGGRTYDLHFNRVYAGGGGAPSNGIIQSNGSVPVQPYLRIFGPITGAAVAFVTTLGTVQHFLVPFLASARIDAATFVGIDTRAHTAYLNDDVTKPMLSQLDWTRIAWPVLPIMPDSTTMSLTGINTTGASQVQASWHDKYL